MPPVTPKTPTRIPLPAAPPGLAAVSPLAPIASAAPAATPRPDLIALGQAARPWEFLPRAIDALIATPHDQGVRFLAAANFARLGLRTLALEMLAELPGEAPEVAALRAAIQGLPPDAIPPQLRHATARANAAILIKRGVLPPLEDWTAWLKWTAALPARRSFRTLEGDAISLPTTAGPSTFTHPRAHANAMLASIAKRDPEDLPGIVLDGLCPYLLHGLYDVLPPTPTGLRRRITIIAPDETALLEALSLADLTRELSDERVEVFAGADAHARFAQQLTARIETRLPRVAVPATPRPVGAVGTLIADAIDAQQHEYTRTRDLMMRLYAGRDAAWWRTRYQSALHGGAPLRILLPTTRFSTVVQHATRGLAAALHRAGCHAEVLIEPDDHSEHSVLAYTRAITALDPDLIVLINYPRASRPHTFPDNIPFVAWLQDAMPHLFDDAIGKAQGPFDFIMGHTFPELFLKYQYPTQRLLPISMVGDGDRFHNGPVNPALAAEHACDIACVTHHSETPEAMTRRLGRELSNQPHLLAAFERLLPEVHAAAAGCDRTCHHLRLREAAATALRKVLGREPDAKPITLLVNNAAIPLLDRILRHQTLEWAAELAREHGWKLHLYGKGWHTHPTLAPFAKGALQHGEDLRAAYQAARLHLHISGTALVHQRVVECFLSGGLCVPRFHRDALSGPRTTAELAIAHRPPDHVRVSDGSVGYTIADHPELMKFAGQCARLGHALPEGIVWCPSQRRRNQQLIANALAPDHDTAWLLGDLADMTFTTKDGLEAVVRRAREDSGWRERTIARVRAVAAANLTHDALAQRMVAMVTKELGAGALREAA